VEAVECRYVPELYDIARGKACHDNHGSILVFKCKYYYYYVYKHLFTVSIITPLI